MKEAVKRVVIALVIILVIFIAMAAVFRERLKGIMVKEYMKSWTVNLLAGSTAEDAEKQTMAERIGEFYSMAVKKLIPSGSVDQLWKAGRRNVGLWYFYLMNFFQQEIRESGMDIVAQQKAMEVVDKFMSYIRDGRVKPEHVAALSEKLPILDPKKSALNSMSKEDVQNALNTIGTLNEGLEKDGPGSPLDPLESFKEIVGRIEKAVNKYKKK